MQHKKRKNKKKKKEIFLPSSRGLYPSSLPYKINKPNKTKLNGWGEQSKCSINIILISPCTSELTDKPKDDSDISQNFFKTELLLTNHLILFFWRSFGLVLLCTHFTQGWLYFTQKHNKVLSPHDLLLHPGQFWWLQKEFSSNTL